MRKIHSFCELCHFVSIGTAETTYKHCCYFFLYMIPLLWVYNHCRINCDFLLGFLLTSQTKKTSSPKQVTLGYPSLQAWSFSTAMSSVNAYSHPVSSPNLQQDQKLDLLHKEPVRWKWRSATSNYSVIVEGTTVWSSASKLVPLTLLKSYIL